MKQVSILGVVAFLLLLIGCNSSSSKPMVVDITPRSDAFIVGVGEYKNNIRPLYGVEKDLKNIRKLLKYLNINNITTLRDDEATLHDIRKLFYSYINSNKNHKDNIFLFYFSGHGIQVDDKNGDEKDKKDEATALYDLALDDKNFIEEGVLLDDELSYLLSQIHSKKILIFDKCHSGSSHREGFKPFVKSIDGEYKLSSSFLNKIDKNIKSKKILTNFIVFSATKDNQEAEDSPLGGLFTNSLIDGIIKKKADFNHNSLITISELEKFCAKNITSLAVDISKKYKISLKGDYTPSFSPKERKEETVQSIFNIK